MKISEEARKNGINPRTAYNRIHVLGWSIKDAVSKPISYTYDKDLAEKAKKNNLSYTFVKRRINILGWTEQEAISTPRGDKERLRKYIYNGRRYTTSELEQLSGINRVILSHRLNTLHWDVKRAITQTVRKRSSRNQAVV